MIAALKPQIHDRTAAGVDRAECLAEKHGTQWYRRKYGCTCPDAIESRHRYDKFYKAGALPSGLVPIAGTARRLQALAANGWSVRALAERWDCDFKHLARWRGAKRPTVHRLNAHFIMRNYAAYCDILGGSERAAQWAIKCGWLSPAQLTTFDIDDPVAGPPGTSRESRLVRQLIPAKRVYLDEVDRLRRFGTPDIEIAERLGVKVHSIQDVERRIRKGVA